MMIKVLTIGYDASDTAMGVDPEISEEDLELSLERFEEQVCREIRLEYPEIKRIRFEREHYDTHLSADVAIDWIDQERILDCICRVWSWQDWIVER